MTRFTLGCDPEFFLKDKETGKIVPAPLVGCTSGSKDKPEVLGRSGAWQVDGLALEFNTNPESFGSDFNARVNTVLQMMRRRVDPKYNFVFEPTAYFTQEDFDALTEEQKALGCDPDFNAYTGEINPSPKQVGLMRTAAGHIHIGWGQDIPVDHPDHVTHCRTLIKALDLFVGIPLIFFEGPEDVERRKMYGAAGAFRPKTYGVEYRTPSNVWVKDSRARATMILGVWQALITLINRGNELMQFVENSHPLIIQAINTSSKEQALTVLKSLSMRITPKVSRSCVKKMHEFNSSSRFPFFIEEDSDCRYKSFVF